MNQSDHARRDDAIACALWVGFAIILSRIIRHNIALHSVVDDYRTASLHWIHSEPIYQLVTIHGFLYLPSSAALTVPLALLPGTAHEFVWRWLSIATLACVTWRLAVILRPRLGRNAFLGLTLVILPISIGSARAGQMNLILAATLVFATADVIDKRWWRCAFWLALALALKPQALVLVLLIAVFIPAMRWRAALAILAALLVPFLLQRPDYVLEQYRVYAHKLVFTGQPGDVGVRYNDLFGLLSGLGLELNERFRWIIRLIAIPFALGLSLLASRRRDPFQASLALLAISCCYLMFFNPHNEGGSYVITAMPLAVYTLWAIEKDRQWRAAALLIAIAVGWTISYELSHQLWSLAHAVGLPTAATFGAGTGPFWLSPLLCLVFAAYLIYVIATRAGPHQAMPAQSKASPEVVPVLANMDAV